MRLKLYCPEGWSFVSWQRLIAIDEFGANVSGMIVDRFDNAGDSEGRLYLSAGMQAEQCLFIESGESATLDDIAEAIGRMMCCEVEPLDEETP